MYTFCVDEKLPINPITLTSKVRRILKSPDSEGFTTIASLVLSHRTDPETLWKDYLEPAIFYKHWPAIKDNMVRYNLGAENISVWQAAYEKLASKYKKTAPPFIEEERIEQKGRYAVIGKKLARLRTKAGMSQQELARKLNTSQQLISRIEKGDENITLLTLSNIARILKVDIKIDLKKKS